jgi:hypothetical protein
MLANSERGTAYLGQLEPGTPHRGRRAIVETTQPTCGSASLPRWFIGERGNRDLSEPERGVELALREQAAVRRGLDAVDSSLIRAVESGSQRQLSGFTRRVPHDYVPSVVPAAL